MLLYWSSIIALVAVVGCGYLVGATPLDFFTYLKSAFDQLHREGEREPKMMSIGLHPRMVGRPGARRCTGPLHGLRAAARYGVGVPPRGIGCRRAQTPAADGDAGS
jgi:hypothetical protein